MSTLKKVASGDSFAPKSGTWNAFVDAAQYVRQRQANIGSSVNGRDTKPGIVWVSNNSGQDQKQFAVLGLDGLAITPEDNESDFRSSVVMTGVTPNMVAHRGRFAILKVPLQSGKIGPAYVDAVTPVTLYVPEESGECNCAEIVDGESDYLQSTFYGSATILWRNGGTGEQWAVVRMGKPPAMLPVTLEQVGGEQGDAQNVATWVYDVKDICTGEILLESVDPTVLPHQWQRPSAGWLVEATFGYAHFDSEGNLALGWINEITEQAACEAEAP
ncbi:MAG: hypothetical protein GWP14_04545 [Actinobacteria bacterium]|nr:hypothetical protein [Actinomycetota bacterium]